MAIDRIGKGAPPAPPKAEKAGSAKPAGEVGKTFAVQPSAPPVTSAVPATSAPAVAPTAEAGSTPLEKLRAGEIDLDRYLDLKVSEATAHLKGLRAHEMEGLRSLLREQLGGDPALVDLVEQATGQRPAPKE